MALAPKLPRNDVKPTGSLSQVGLAREQETMLYLWSVNLCAGTRVCSERSRLPAIRSQRLLQPDAHVLRFWKQRRLQIDENVPSCD